MKTLLEHLDIKEWGLHDKLMIILLFIHFNIFWINVMVCKMSEKKICFLKSSVKSENLDPTDM